MALLPLRVVSVSPMRCWGAERVFAKWESLVARLCSMEVRWQCRHYSIICERLYRVHAGLVIERKKKKKTV